MIWFSIDFDERDTKSFKQTSISHELSCIVNTYKKGNTFILLHTVYLNEQIVRIINNERSHSDQIRFDNSLGKRRSKYFT